MSNLTVPPVVGQDIQSILRWARQVSLVVNEFVRRNITGAFFIWDDGCVTVPTSTDINGAEELVFESPFSGNGTLIVAGIGFEGGVHVALNDTDLGSLSDANTSDEILYEVQVTNLVDGLNSFKIWSTTSDTGELRRLEAWRNFSRELIDTAGSTAEWGEITGVGKPEDNADVTADHGQTPDWLTALVASGHIDADSVEAVLDALNLINGPAESGADVTSANGQPPSWLTALIASGDIDAASVEAVLDALNLLNAPAEAGADVTDPRLQGNALINGSFETGTLSGWTVVTGGANWEVNTNDPHVGTYNLQNLASTNGRIRNDSRLQVSQGDRVLAQGFVRTNGTGTSEARVNIRFRDESDTLLDSAFGATNSTSTYAISRAVGVAPAGAAVADFEFELINADGTRVGVFDGAYMAIIPKDSDIDALETTNGPTETDSDKTTNNLILAGDSDTNPAVGASLGSTESTFNGGVTTEWQPLRSFVTNFTGTFRLMVEARKNFSFGSTADDGGWRLKNGAGTVVHTETITLESFSETFSDEETVTTSGETWTIEALSKTDLSTFTLETEIRDTEVRARFDHVIFS